MTCRMVLAEVVGRELLSCRLWGAGPHQWDPRAGLSSRQPPRLAECPHLGPRGLPGSSCIDIILWQTEG